MLRMFLWVSVRDVDLACLLVPCLVWLHKMNEVSSLSVLGLLGEEFMFVFFTSLVKCSTESIWSWIEFFFFLLFVCLVGFIFLCLGMFYCWFGLFSCFWLWKFPTSLWFSADRSYVLNPHPISFPNLSATPFVSFLWCAFVFLVTSCNVFFFIFDFVFIFSLYS